jgi:hypothetical protein
MGKLDDAEARTIGEMERKGLRGVLYLVMIIATAMGIRRDMDRRYDDPPTGGAPFVVAAVALAGLACSTRR